MIGPYFFEKDNGMTVNSKRYGHVITDFILPVIEEHDGTTSHTNRRNMIMRFDNIRLFCGAKQNTVFMQINL